jgi:glycosyltransferase involved in cell wall biosynthesis
MFYDDHPLVPRFRALSTTHVFPMDAPAQWGTGNSNPLLTFVAVVARKAVNMVRLVRKIARHVSFLRTNKVDLLHLNNSISRHHDWMVAALLTRVPCVVHERGLPEYGASDRFFARRLSLIIPVSRAIARAMVDQGVSPDNLRVMYDGLNPAKLKPATSADTLRAEWNVRPEQPIVGIVGNIREWKGQETVVRALIEVVKAQPDVVCFFVGATTPLDQPYMDRLTEMIAKANIQPNVRFTGYQKDVPSIVHMMRFVIHASVAPEPFGMVVLEAMAQRRPVVVSRAGGVVEMVVEGETGYTFPPGDARELAARMIQLLENPRQAEKMGERGYERLVADFSLQSYMSDIHGAYRSILSGRQLPAATNRSAVVSHS